MNELRQKKTFSKNENILSLKTVSKNKFFEHGSCKIINLASHEDGKLYADNMEDYDVKIATSCLVQPLAGDRVYAVIDKMDLVVTSILSRSHDDDTLKLNGQGRKLYLNAPEIRIQAEENLTLQTANFSLLTRSSKWISETIHQISQRLFVKSSYANRKIEQTDKSEAKHLMYEADQSLVMKSEVGSIQSTSVLKIDGAQIHMG